MESLFGLQIEDSFLNCWKKNQILNKTFLLHMTVHKQAKYVQALFRFCFEWKDAHNLISH